MRRRNKILVVVALTVSVLFSMGAGVGYYLMSQYPILADAFGNNPLAVLEAAARIGVNQVTSTPTKSFNIEDIDVDYNRTVEFPENRLELETAEQIIEWSVIHQSQPWIDNITEFLQESEVPIGDATLHLAFLNTESSGNPVMTVTYIISNKTQIVEKGWQERVTYNSYTGLVTEDFAVAALKKYPNTDEIVKSIIQNLDGAIRVTRE